MKRNSVWTSGQIGLRRLNREADVLMDKAAEAIQQSGATIVARKEI